MLTTRGIPSDARVFSLLKGRKIAGSGHAHHDAIPVEDFADLGQNLGIRLDPHFLVVDIDHDSPPWERELPQTWTQRTPGGTHYLFRVPHGWRGWNQKIKIGTNGSAKILGDIKVNGYIVAPGSEVVGERGRPGGRYELLVDVDPVLAPEWLLALALVRPAAEERFAGIERKRILTGENDHALTAIAGALRRQGFSEDFIAGAIAHIGDDPALMEQDPARGYYLPGDYKRIAHSIATKPPGEADLLLADPAITFGSETPIVGAPIRWWVHGFFPRHELVMLYGKGKVGKGTLGSWLAAAVTAQGGRMLVISTEESFPRFLGRAVHCGANRSLICSYDKPSAIKLPGGLDQLKAAVELMGGVDIIWFDAIYAHFSGEKGQNSAERARQCLTPLAEWAQAGGPTIIAVFHENKGGDYLGSVEMVNVARHVLKATRRRGQPLHLDVDHTNLYDPEVTAVFDSQLIDWIDPETGEAQLEQQKDGTIGQAHLRIAHRLPDLPKQRGADTAIEEVEMGEVADRKKKRPKMPFE